MLCRFTTL